MPVCSCGVTFTALPGVEYCSIDCAALARGYQQRRPPAARHLASTVDRGYGEEHRREREAWRPVVEAGEAICWRCGKAIAADGPWDMGHISKDPVVYGGPEHRGCNRKAGLAVANAQRAAARRPS